MAKRNGARTTRGGRSGGIRDSGAARALPQGRHGFSPVGRRNAQALAARTTAFADTLLSRPRLDVMLPASAFLRTLRRQTLTPPPSSMGRTGLHYDLSRDLLHRYGIDASLPQGRGDRAMSRRHNFSSYMLLAQRGGARAAGGQYDPDPADDVFDDPWSAADWSGVTGTSTGAVSGRGGAANAPAATPPMIGHTAARAASTMVISPLVATMVNRSAGASVTPARTFDIQGDTQGSHETEGSYTEASRQLYGWTPWQPGTLPAGTLPLTVSRETPPEDDDVSIDADASLLDVARVAPPVPNPMGAPMTMLPELLSLTARLQRKEQPGMAAPVVAQRTLALRQAAGSSGQPLDHGTRRVMETTLGGEFSGVRVHTDGAAANAATTLSAHAFALGTNVYFAQGAYAPSSPAGLALLGHELVHTMQQGGEVQRRVAPSSSLSSRSDDATLHEPARLEAQALYAEAMLLRMFSDVSSPSLAALDAERIVPAAGQGAMVMSGRVRPPSLIATPLMRRVVGPSALPDQTGSSTVSFYAGPAASPGQPAPFPLSPALAASPGAFVNRAIVSRDASPTIGRDFSFARANDFSPRPSSAPLDSGAGTLHEEPPFLAPSAHGYLVPRPRPAAQRAFGETWGDSPPQPLATHDVWRSTGMTMLRQTTDSGGAGLTLAPTLAGGLAWPAQAAGSLQRFVGASGDTEQGGWRTGTASAGVRPDDSRLATRPTPMSGSIGQTSADAPDNLVATPAALASEPFYSSMSRMALPLTARVDRMLPALVGTPPLRVMRAAGAQAVAVPGLPASAGVSSAIINRITTMPSLLSSSLAFTATAPGPSGVGAVAAGDARTAEAPALIRRYSSVAPFSLGVAEPAGGVGAIVPHEAGTVAGAPFAPASQAPSRDVRLDASSGLLTGIGGVLVGVDPDTMVHDQVSPAEGSGGLLNRWSDQAAASAPGATGAPDATDASLEGAPSLTLATATPLRWGHANSVARDGWAGTDGALAWQSLGGGASTPDGASAATVAGGGLFVHRFSADVARGAGSLGGTLSRTAESVSGRVQAGAGALVRRFTSTLQRTSGAAPGGGGMIAADRSPALTAPTPTSPALGLAGLIEPSRAGVLSGSAGATYSGLMNASGGPASVSPLLFGESTQGSTGGAFDLVGSTGGVGTFVQRFMATSRDRAGTDEPHTDVWGATRESMVDSAPYTRAMAASTVARSDAGAALRRFTGDLSLASGSDGMSFLGARSFRQHTPVGELRSDRSATPALLRANDLARYSDNASGHSAILSRFTSIPSGNSVSLWSGAPGASAPSFGAGVTSVARAAGAGFFAQRYSGADQTPQGASYGGAPIGLAGHGEHTMMVARSDGAATANRVGEGNASGVTVGMGSLVRQYSGNLPDFLGRQATTLEDSHAGSADDTTAQPRSAEAPGMFAGAASLNIFRDLQRHTIPSVASIAGPDSRSIVQRAPDAGHTMVDGGRDRSYGAMVDGGRAGDYGAGSLAAALTVGSLGDLLVNRTHTTSVDGASADGTGAPFSTSNDGWNGSSMGGGALVGRATYVSSGYPSADGVDGSSYGAAAMDTSPTFVQRTFVPMGANGSTMQRRVPGAGPAQGSESNGNGHASSATNMSVIGGASDESAGTGDQATMERMVDEVIGRVKRELAIEHERNGGFQPGFMG